MKTERRHELQKNDLADYLGKHLQTSQPYLKWGAIAAVVVLVVVVVGAFLTRRAASEVAQAWEEFYSAQSAEDPTKPLEDVATVYEDTDAGLWARQAKANFALNQASFTIYSQRDEAERLLKEAVEGFQEVSQRAGGNEFLLQHARYGLAMAYEMQGELKKAREQYEQVIADGDGSALADQAQQRLDRLKNEDIREFYAWFSEQEMTTPEPGASNLPGDLMDLPNFPDLSLPSAPPSETPPAEPMPPAGTATPEDTPAPSATETETPAEATPETPAASAEDETPEAAPAEAAEETPAEAPAEPAGESDAAPAEESDPPPSAEGTSP